MPSLAMIALGERPQISGTAIVRDLAKNWPALPPATAPEQSGTSLTFSVGDTLVALGLMPAPIPWGDLEGPCATSWLWPEAEAELKKHKQHLIVFLAKDDDPIESSKLLTQVVAAVIATCPQTIGVYWGNATLVVSPPVFRSFAKEMLPDGLPLPIWIDFRVGPGENGRLFGFTHGMQALGHKELETLNSPESPGGLRERLMDLCGYLLQNGPVIQDGHTVGHDANEKIRVTFAPSSFGHEGQVMRLDYSAAGDGGKKPWWRPR